MKKAVLTLCMLSLLVINTVYAEITSRSYRQVDPAEVPGLLPQAEIIEFFWYECPHCYRMESLLREAGLDKKVTRVPAVLRVSWMYMARVFYAMQAMGVDQKLHLPVFDEIHKHKNDLQNEAQLMAFLNKHGINGETFLKHFNSDAVNQQVQNAAILTVKYAEEGVPAFIVNRRFVTSPNLAGSLSETLSTVKHLLEK